MLQSLKLDTSKVAAKQRQRTEEPPSPSDPAFSGALALAASHQPITHLPTPVKSSGTEAKAASSASTKSAEASSRAAREDDRSKSKPADSREPRAGEKASQASPAQQESRNVDSDSRQQARTDADQSTTEAQNSTASQIASAPDQAASSGIAAAALVPPEIPGSSTNPGSGTTGKSSTVNVQTQPVQVQAQNIKNDPSASSTEEVQQNAAKSLTPDIQNHAEPGQSDESSPAAPASKTPADSKAAARTTSALNPSQITATASSAASTPAANVQAKILQETTNHNAPGLKPDATETKTESEGNHSVSTTALPLPSQIARDPDPLPSIDPSQRHATIPITGDMSSLQIARTETATTATMAPARPAPAAAQMEGSIRWMLHSQEKSAELQLHPENLGRVTISLKVEGQEVHARVWASESSTATALQEHRSALELSLREQGLNLGSFDLQSGHRGEDARSGGQSLPSGLLSGTPQEAESKQDVPMTTAVVLTNPHRIELLA